MGKNRSAAGLTNIIQYDNNGNISFVSGSTILLRVSSSGAITTTGVISGSNALSASYAISSSYSANTDNLNGFGSTSYVTTSSFSTVSSSAASRITNLESASGSFSTRVTNIESNYATTGSNTLTGTQNITSTTQPTNFDSTAALYTAGGLRVKGNVYFSSSLYLKGDLTVYGTQSINYITSSQLDISDNIINVNTAVPGVRFGGIAVYDSGSTGLTGSFLWDSQNNKWIYSNPSGSSYDGGMAIFGPRNTSGLGNEQGTTANYIIKGQGGDHITSSVIYESASMVSIGTSTPLGDFTVSNPTTVNTYIVSAGGDYDTNLYLGYAGAYTDTYVKRVVGNLSLGTSATDRIYITSTGNIGIGTTNPGAKLEVWQATNNRLLINYVNSANEPQISSLDSSNNPQYLTINSYDLKFKANGTEAMRITSGGNVGIGVTSPVTALQVGSGSASSIPSWMRIMTVDSTQTGVGAVYGNKAIYIYNNGSELKLDAYDYAASAGLSVRVAGNGGNAIIGSGADISIGTSNLVISNNTITNSRALVFYSANSYNPRAWIIHNTSTGAQSLEFNSTYGSGTGTANFIFSSGNVGIGTSSPAEKLQVNGNICLNNGGYGMIYANDTNHCIIMRGDRNGNAADYTNYYQYGGNIADGKGHKFWTGGVLASQSLRFHIGNDYTYNTGNMTIGGTLTESSSIRYKTNIETVKYGLDKVLQLRGVTYDKKDTGVRELGLIAEEVNEILPDVVIKNEEGEPDSVSYGRLTAVLIEAVKDLQTQINELKGK